MNKFKLNKKIFELIKRRYTVYRMKRLRKAGWTLQRIADKYGITRQRVHQIVGKTKDGN